MKVTVSTTVNAPIDKVFGVFSDVTKIEERIDGIQKVEMLSDVTSGKGVKWRETRVMFGKEATEEMEITSYEKNKQYVVEADSHGTHYTSLIDFTEQDGQTTVTQVFEGKPYKLSSRLFALLGFLFKAASKKALQKDFDNLKTYIESSN